MALAFLSSLPTTQHGGLRREVKRWPTITQWGSQPSKNLNSTLQSLSPMSSLMDHASCHIYRPCLHCKIRRFFPPWKGFNSQSSSMPLYRHTRTARKKKGWLWWPSLAYLECYSSYSPIASRLEVKTLLTYPRDPAPSRLAGNNGDFMPSTLQQLG